MTAQLPPLPFFPERLRDYLMPAERVIVERLLHDFAKLAVREALCQLADDIDTWPTVAGSSGFYSDEIRRIAKERYK